MVIFFIVTSSIVALLIDYYIYTRVIKRHGNFGQYWRIGYIIYAVVVDVSVVVSLILYWAASDKSSEALRAVMWVQAFFFLNYAPKLTYALISWGDYVVQWIRRRRGNNKMSHYFGYTAVVLSAVVGFMMLYSITYGRTTIRVERVELSYPNLPEAFDGLTIVQFSDVHLATLANSDVFLNRMVDTINTIAPDIVVHTGDMVNSHARELDEKTMSIFRRIENSEGIYSIMGNHDMGIYIKDTIKYSMEENVEELINKQQQMGWIVLRDSTVYLQRGEDSISISGLNYPLDFKLQGHSSRMTGADINKTYKGVPDSVFNLSLSHAPQLWNDLLEARKADLTLAGHVHAMQCVFKIGKFKLSPAMFMYDRWSGLYEEDGSNLYINDGVGCVMFHLRIGTKPEVTLFTLRSGS